MVLQELMAALVQNSRVYGLELCMVWCACGFGLKEKLSMSVSFEVRLFWEGATCSSDNDVGSVVCSLHALI